MNKFLYPLIAIVIAAVLAGCEKKETASEEAEAPNTAHEENIVTLTKKNLENIKIEMEPVKFGDLEIALKAAGRVSENMNKTAKVASTLEGRLIKLNFDINDQVKARDVLALVQTPELLGKPLEIMAPMDGVIIARNNTVGELVGKESNIYTISDPSDLWVIAEIKERDVAAVKVGQNALFGVLAYPDAEFHGKVVRIGNQIEIDSRTLEVRIETENADGRLKAGMFADVEIATTIMKDVLTIPDAALQTLGDDEIVFVKLDNDRFEKREIKSGMKQGGRVQVIEGLKSGEMVVAEGSFILKSELLKGDLQDKD